jgi:hypothetical protein
LRFASIAAFLAATLAGATAHAAGFSAAVLGGNGFKDGYDGAVGLRAGFTLPALPIYAGGTFVYHFGTTDSEGRLKVLYLGPEGGYDIALGPVTLRPYIGLGYASISTDVQIVTPALTLDSGTEHTGKFVLWPGVSALFPLDSAFVGLDARYVVVTDSDTFNALSVCVTAGFEFH